MFSIASELREIQNALNHEGLDSKAAVFDRVFDGVYKIYGLYTTTDRRAHAMGTSKV